MDLVCDMGDTAASRTEAWRQAEDAAQRLAEQGGALPGTCTLVSKEEIPLAYLPGHRARLRCQLVGDLGLQRPVEAVTDDQGGAFVAEAEMDRGQATSTCCRTAIRGREETPFPEELAAWKPQVSCFLFVFRPL